jgi:hypothetical protein
MVGAPATDRSRGGGDSGTTRRASHNRCSAGTRASSRPSEPRMRFRTDQGSSRRIRRRGTPLSFRLVGLSRAAKVGGRGH